MGAWIEIKKTLSSSVFTAIVAPLMGAWIEIIIAITSFIGGPLVAPPHGRVD